MSRPAEGRGEAVTYLLRDLPLRELLALRWELDMEMLQRLWWLFLPLSLVVATIGVRGLWRELKRPKKPRP